MWPKSTRFLPSASATNLRKCSPRARPGRRSNCWMKPGCSNRCFKKFVRLPRFEEHLTLHRLDCLSSHRHLDSYQFVCRFLEVTPPEQVRPERLLTGDDLQTMGFRPSPLFSRILRALEDAQLEGQVATREEAEKYVLSTFGAKERKAPSN